MCGKKGYSSKRTARLANSHHGRTMRFYLCPECKLWHGTKERTPGK